MKDFVVRESRIHRKGVFAAQDIPKGKRIVQYTGRRLTKAQAANSTSDYLFELNSRYDIDGKNHARYINHSCEPNCEVEITKGQIWIKSLREIKKGEELAYNYGYTLDDCENYPCNCSTEPCLGFIISEDARDSLRKIHERTAAILKNKGFKKKKPKSKT